MADQPWELSSVVAARPVDVGYSHVVMMLRMTAELLASCEEKAEVGSSSVFRPNRRRSNIQNRASVGERVASAFREQRRT
jgi:hypothetical protein